MAAFNDCWLPKQKPPKSGGQRRRWKKDRTKTVQFLFTILNMPLLKNPYPTITKESICSGFPI